MSYEFREVICPYCKHQYMFRKNEGGIKCGDYIDKTTGKIAIAEYCPKCGKWLYALDSVLEGVREDDARIVYSNDLLDEDD